MRNQDRAILLDPHGRIHRFERDGSSFVSKRRPLLAGQRELERAVEARRRLHGQKPAAPFPVEVVVPELVAIESGECLLTAPDLGDPLAMDLVLAGQLLPRHRLIVLLASLMDAGVEAPGFVPRNLFYRDGRLYVIDWEDAEFITPSASPDRLTAMKWDIAWSDAFMADPQLRLVFADRLRDDAPLDSFEQALASLTDPTLDSVQLRERGVAMTLTSELHVPSTLGVTAAELGHLADEVLLAEHSVLYTALSARVRSVAGDEQYARFIENLWQTAQNRRTREPGASTADAAGWLYALCTTADSCMSLRPPLVEVHQQLMDLAEEDGWDAALRRAVVAEDLLTRVCDLVVSALALTGLQLILRGSLAQGIVSRRSDLDFELSGRLHPHGHHGVERLVLDILAAFDLDAEASEGRPTEADIYDPRSGLARDLHEWMELRRPGSDLHDPGWLKEFLDVSVSSLVDTQSEYERAGRQRSAKYIWFEVRTLLARLAFKNAAGRPPATVTRQIELLSGHVEESHAAEIQDLLLLALTLREQDIPAPADYWDVQDRLTELRHRLELPGPSPLSS